MKLPKKFGRTHVHLQMITPRFCYDGAMRSVVFLLALALAPAVQAAGSARTYYESATRHYNLAEYDAALRDFKEAYRLKPDPAFLFNIAQCYRQLGDPTNAATFYRNYRREAPDAPNRKEVERLIEEMDRAAAAERARQPPVGVEPPREPATSTPEPTPAPAPAAVTLTAPLPAASRPIHKKPWFWAVVAGGAAVVATGVALGVVYGTPAQDPMPTFGTIQGD